MPNWLRLLLVVMFRRRMHKWYKTYQGDFFNIDSAELLYVTKHENPHAIFGVNSRSDYDGLWHVFSDQEPISKGYNTEEEAREVLNGFMRNLNFYDVNYFMVN